jgi:glycosyltransferase involved in cell wall biosynthesis
MTVRPLRIALVAGEDPGWGGIGTYTGVLAVALQQAGHDVRLVLRGWEADTTEAWCGIPVERVTVPEPAWRRGTVGVVSRLYTSREVAVFSARAARRIVSAGPFDVVEAPDFQAPGVVAALRRRITGRRPAVVVRLHSSSRLVAWLEDAKFASVDARTVGALEAAAIRLADAVTVPSAIMARELGRRAPSAVVVPNPVDTAWFSAEPDEEEPATILCVGRVERAKGQDLLVDALPAVRRYVPNARLRCVGDDSPRSDGSSFIEWLRARTEASGLPADAVEFTGALPREQVPWHYRRATVCAVPSRFESFGYACAEAMSCARAVVAADVGALRDLVTNGRDGSLVSAEDPHALAVELGGLLQDRARRRRLGSEARATIVRRYAADRVAAEMATVYRRHAIRP